LGRARDVVQIGELAARLASEPTRLHVFARAEAVVDAASLAAEVRATAKGRFVDGECARDGELVLDVIAGDASEDVLVGWHRHDDTHGPWPGGVVAAEVPAESPSRAWAKIEEAIAWSMLAPRAGERVVELGCAPGGTSLALLARGLEVHGVDPGPMDPRVLTFRGPGGNRFVHHAVPAADVAARALPRPIDWLASDINLAPMIALRYVERIVALARGTLRGAFLTLKLNDDAIVDALPRLAARIDKLGARRVRYTQLPSHRREIVAILEW
jgi:23S rRNA (cytidine2498-2'-O)-methyltransferase